MGEMVQYKYYHLDDTPPYYLDRDSAVWARGAERAGYFSKSLPVDSRSLTGLNGTRPTTQSNTHKPGHLVRVVRSYPAPTGPPGSSEARPTEGTPD
jgi:hypothetical protein